MSQFEQLLDDLAAEQRRRDAARAAGRRRAPTQSRHVARPIQAMRPDRAFAKAMADLNERHAAGVLHGLRLGSVVLARGLAGPHRLIDLDAGAGRAKLRQLRDASSDPRGVNFVESEAWAALADLSLAPGYEDSGTASFSDSLALSGGLRASEARIEGIRDQARRLVAAKRAELSAALKRGEIGTVDAVQSEILLNSFCVRMGL